MSGPGYMFRQTPGGSSRDTYTTFRMRQRLGIAPRPAPAERWAGLSLATRQQLCTAAVGMRGLDLYALAWDEIAPRDRLRIVAEASRMAEGLAS